MSTTPQGAEAPAPSPRPRRYRIERVSLPPDSPERAARRARRIKLERAVNLIARTKCPCAVAGRAVGIFNDRDAMYELYELCDRKGISRVKKGVRRVAVPGTPSEAFAAFVPRQDHRQREAGIAEMLRELREIADPLRDDVPHAPKPLVTCVICGDIFGGRKDARFCSGKCRAKDWRRRHA